MKKILFGLVSVIIIPLILSCDRTPKEPELLDLVITMLPQGTDMVIEIVPSEEETAYTFFSMPTETFNKECAEESQLTSYINTKLSSGELKDIKGVHRETMTDLGYFSSWTVVAAQTFNGALFGKPVVKTASTFRDFVSFDAGNMMCPSAISDNGLWVVGSGAESSFVYDVVNDSLIIKESVVLNDISDNGIACGYTKTNSEAYIFNVVENKEEFFTFDNAAEASFMGISYDGTTCVGYVMDSKTSNFTAILYEDEGILTNLSAPKDPKEGAAVDIYIARNIAQNGIIVGYLVENETSAEMSCQWNPTTTGYEPFSGYGTKWNDEFSWWDDIYGSMFTYISPDGRFVSSAITDTGTDGWSSDVYAFMYDTESKVAKPFINSDILNYRVDCVTSDGVILLSDAQMGLSSVPFVYTEEGGKATLQSYLAGKYAYDFTDRDISGSCIGVSLDCKKYLTAEYNDAAGYTTKIYFMK